MQVAVLQLRWAFVLQGNSGWDRNILRGRTPCKGYMHKHLQTLRLNNHQRPWVVSQPDKFPESSHWCMTSRTISMLLTVSILLSQVWLTSLWNLPLLCWLAQTWRDRLVYRWRQVSWTRVQQRQSWLGKSLLSPARSTNCCLMCSYVLSSQNLGSRGNFRHYLIHHAPGIY